MFFANIKIDVEPRIFSSLQDKYTEFDCQILTNILGILNKGPRVFEIKIIPTIKGFIYNETIALHIGTLDFAPGAKIKSQDLLLQPKIIHRIIAHNILPKKGHYDKVIFMDMCLIHCMIKGRLINLVYIMIRNIIMAYNQKQKFFPYGKTLTSIFENFKTLLLGTDRNLYYQLMEIDNRTLTKMKYVFNEDGVWVFRDHLGVYVEEEHEEEEQCEGNDDEIEAMFETPLLVLSPKVASSSSW